MLVDLLIDLLGRHAEQQRPRPDVLPSGRFHLEAGDELEQRADVPGADDACRAAADRCPAITFSSVLLPAPLCPISPTRSPDRIESVTSCSACTTRASSGGGEHLCLTADFSVP